MYKISLPFWSMEDLGTLLSIFTDLYKYHYLVIRTLSKKKEKTLSGPPSVDCINDSQSQIQ